MHDPEQAGRPRRGVAGLLLVGLLVGLLVLGTVVGAAWWLSRDSYDAAPVSPAEDGVDPAGAASALRALEDALASGDPAAASRLAPAGDPDARDLLSAIGGNVDDIGLVDITARYVDEAGAVAADGSWPAEVDLTWRIDDLDRRTATSEVTITFRPDGDRVGIEAFGGGPRTPLWLTGPLGVQRAGNALVMVAGEDPDTAAWAERVRRGVPVVRRVLPDWRGPVVVEVASSAAQVDAALGEPAGTYAQVAAVTASADGSAGPDAPVRIVVNPEVTDRLRQRGAQVVTTHEMVHVATDALSTGSMPAWLLEGFPDYVALRDVPLPVTTAASRAIQVVRRDGAPRRLPDVQQLGTQAPDLQAAYEMAWLACVALAEAAGEEALVDVYEAVDGGEPVERVLRREAGLGLGELTRLWQDRLRTLAQ